MTYTRSGVGTDTVTASLLPGPNQFRCAATGHIYQVVDGAFTFDAALSGAADQFGGRGYLATITSEEENECVSAGIGAYTGSGRNAWIAAHLVSGSVQDWEWVAGPEAGSTFWTGGTDGSSTSGFYAAWDRDDPSGAQPQNDANQACGQYCSRGSGAAWHDNGCSAINKYVAEGDPAEIQLPTATAAVETAPAPPDPGNQTSTGVGVGA